MGRLQGKTALVTGAGFGLGRAIAVALAREGASVAVNDWDLDTAKQTVEMIKPSGNKSFAVKADVSNYKQVSDMVKTVLGEVGRLDILVNNAGGSARERCTYFIESSEEIWDFVIGRNLKGVLNCTRAVVNHMKDNGAGKIVNIGSVAGVIGGVGQADYSASKAGVIGFTRVLAKEVGQFGINVNCVSPGIHFGTHALETMDPAKVDIYLERQVLKRRGTPEDIANAVVFLVSEEASFITGQNLVVCGGVSL